MQDCGRRPDQLPVTLVNIDYNDCPCARLTCRMLEMVIMVARCFGQTSYPRIWCCSEKVKRSLLNSGGNEDGNLSTATERVSCTEASAIAADAHADSLQGWPVHGDLSGVVGRHGRGCCLWCRDIGDVGA